MIFVIIAIVSNVLIYSYIISVEIFRYFKKKNRGKEE